MLSMTVKKVNMSCILDHDVQEILDIDENILVGLGGIGIGKKIFCHNRVNRIIPFPIHN